MIYIIRHAESIGNAGAKTNNAYDIPLSDKGEIQAIEISKKINKRPDLIVVSPYLRTQQTANPLIEKYKRVKIETWNVQEFTYLDAKRCNNTTKQERLGIAQEYMQKNDPDFIHGEGAESFNMLIERIDNLIEKMKNIPDDKFVIIFSHGFFMETLAKRIKRTELSIKEMFSKLITTSNGAIIEIKKDNNVLTYSTL